MKTTHRTFFKNAKDMSELDDEEINLIITSPPYPMIEMWDSPFASMNEGIDKALNQGYGKKAFNLMHQELDKIWTECKRVLQPGGIACINIGDATRKLDKTFQLYPNHVKISEYFQANGFISLPCILWRKPTNSPTKFLGSGMIPPNAYITLEHEYILIFKKGNKKRKFPPKSERRYKSSYFWEERNKWFSDIWTDIQGTSQYIEGNRNEDLRERSAAFPLELPYRLINMFSIYGDKILDPFWGTGTTSLAAMVCARNSIGYEINPKFRNIFEMNYKKLKELTRSINYKRLNDHIKFIKKYIKEKKDPNYRAVHYNFPVITSQEKSILLYSVEEIEKETNKYNLIHNKYDFNGDLPNKKKLIQSRLIP